MWKSNDPNQFAYFSFFAKEGTVVFRTSNLQCLKYNNHIQDRKLVLEERNMDEMIPNERISLTTHSVVFLNLIAHWYETLIWSLFLRASESCEKSRAGNVGKLLSVLDALGTKLEIFRPSTNKLEEIPCGFFVNIIWKNRNQNSFYCFPIVFLLA